MSKTYKVVYNDCYGGFHLSTKAISRLRELGVHYDDDYYFNKMERHHPFLIQVVEELGPDASGRFSNLSIATINMPAYIIDEYDGAEYVTTPRDISWVKIEK